MCVCVCVCVCSAKPIQLCPALCDPYSLYCGRLLCPRDSQARMLEWAAMPPDTHPPGDLPDPGMEPASLRPPALAGGFFTTSATWEACYGEYLFIVCKVPGTEEPAENRTIAQFTT